MKLSPVPNEIAKAGLRAIKTACLNSGADRLSPLQTQLLDGIQKYILHSEFDLESLSTISPEELASVVKDSEFAKRVISGGIVTACIDGEMNPKILEQLETFAHALNTDTKPLRAAWNLANHNLVLARFDIIRKSLPGVKIKETFKDEGLLATVKQFLPLRGVTLPEVTARYRELEKYPEGTLGRAFTNYLNENKFPFPGEAGAGPEIIVLHDCLHILGDYGTSAPEEIEIASFQVGCHFDEFIYGILFGLAQYHLNIQMAPVAASQAMQANPEKMVAAFARGCKVNRDMWTDFKPWDHFHKTVAELRLELEIAPKTVI
jgi:tellurite resistance protein